MMRIERRTGRVYVDGKEIRELSAEEQNNLRLRLASYIRTHELSVVALFYLATNIADLYGDYAGSGKVILEL